MDETKTGVRLLTRREVQERLHVSESTVRRLVTDGDLSASKVRGQLRFSEADVAAFLQTAKVPA